MQYLCGSLTHPIMGFWIQISSGLFYIFFLYIIKRGYRKNSKKKNKLIAIKISNYLQYVKKICHGLLFFLKRIVI